MTIKANPAYRAASVTPHDANSVADFMVTALYVGTGGDVAITTSGSDEVTFTSVPSGSILPVEAKIVKATGTTASNIIALGQ